MAAAGLTACAVASGAPLSGTWQLTRMNGAAPPGGATIRFTDGELAGTAFCNAYGGDYRIRAGRLVVGAMHVTQRACVFESVDDASVDLMAAERTFLDVLAARPMVSRRGAELTLRAGGARALVFRAGGHIE